VRVALAVLEHAVICNAQSVNVSHDVNTGMLTFPIPLQPSLMIYRI